MMESSSILNLSKRSANKLMDIMSVLVKESDIESANEGHRSLDVTRVDMTIRCANSIANIVQTNVNLLKAMKSK
jgi:hypothetical protein